MGGRTIIIPQNDSKNFTLPYFSNAALASFSSCSDLNFSFRCSSLTSFLLGALSAFESVSGLPTSCSPFQVPISGAWSINRKNSFQNALRELYWDGVSLPTTPSAGSGFPEVLVEFIEWMWVRRQSHNDSNAMSWSIDLKVAVGWWCNSSHHQIKSWIMSPCVQ